MALQLFGFHDRQHDVAATKGGFPLESCAFLLDFSRQLEKHRWLGFRNRWVGFTVGLLVPVIHIAEEKGGFVFGLSAGEPYFADIQKLWKEHYGSARSLAAPPTGGLEVVADFARHFPSDCQ